MEIESNKPKGEEKGKILDFNSIDLSVENLIQKQDELITSEFFFELRNRIDLEREEAIQKAYKSSEILLTKIKEEEELYYKKIKPINYNDYKTKFFLNTLEKYKRSFDLAEHECDDATRLEHYVVLKILHSTIYDTLFKHKSLNSKFFSDLLEGGTLKKCNAHGISRRQFKLNLLKSFEDIDSSSLTNIILPTWFFQKRLYIVEDLFEISGVLWVLKFKICKFREYVAYHFGGEDREWHAKDLADTEVITASFTPVCKEDSESNFFCNKIDKRVCKLLGFSLRVNFEGKPKKLNCFHFDSKRGFENRFLVFYDSNITSFDLRKLNINCQISTGPRDYYSYFREDLQFSKPDSNELLNWLLNANSNCFCFVSLFTDFIQENYNNFESCWQGFSYILIYFSSHFNLETYFLLILACDRWFSRGIDVNKIFDSFLEDPKTKTSDLVVLDLIMMQLLQQNPKNNKLILKTRLNFTKNSFIKVFLFRNANIMVESFKPPFLINTLFSMLISETNVEMIINLFFIIESFADYYYLTK